MPQVENIDVTVQSHVAPQRWLRACAALAGLAALAFSSVLLPQMQAQTPSGPVLSVQPTNTMEALAGNGTLGYAGDAGAATSASLAAPAGTAADAAGNLYIADSNNNVIRKVDTQGNITTFAGSNLQGFDGDGGQATSALLDTPMGVAVDASGNLYIADTHNQRIRMVNAAGVISTIAGNGTAGYSGDNAAATAAGLFLPQGLALDSAGNLYIADTGNHRIRKISGGVITTVAGNGVQGDLGDGSTATAASLDTPTGVAVNAAGNLYIADSHNNSIRLVNIAGNISTVAGSGALGYSGDTSTATSAKLADPTGIAVDAAGSLYIADSNNNVIRQVSGSTINTVAGNGVQGYGGETGSPLSASLDTPRSASLDLLGDVILTDSLNQRVRAIQLPGLVFATQTVGTASTAQSVTIGNTGGAPMTIQTIAITGGFTVVSGGSCSAVPFTVTPGANCTVNLAFVPIITGAQTGTAVIEGTDVTSQTIALSGVGSPGIVPPTPPSTWVDFVFNLPANFINSITVLAGEKAVFQIPIGPASGSTFATTITFSLAGLPSGATATFAPASILAGTGATTVVLTIQTTSVTAKNHMPFLPWHSPAAPLAVGLLFLPVFGLKKVRCIMGRSPRILSILLLAAVGLGTAVGLAGCATGVGFFKPNAQTSNLTLTAASGGGQSSIPLTLIVE